MWFLNLSQIVLIALGVSESVWMKSILPNSRNYCLGRRVPPPSGVGGVQSFTEMNGLRDTHWHLQYYMNNTYIFFQHMIRYRYIPFTWGKPKFAKKEEEPAASGAAPSASMWTMWWKTSAGWPHSPSMIRLFLLIRFTI